MLGPLEDGGLPGGPVVTGRLLLRHDAASSGVGRAAGRDARALADGAPMPGGRRHRAGGLRQARAAGAYLGRGHPRP
eukprot:2910415-Pyramimonas_sp.AAC.1